jgi:chromosomal replication initiation ATPase DnaA
MKGQQSSVDHRAESIVNAIQWAAAKVFRVSLHDLAFGTTTLHINDYPQQLRLACTAGLYLCRKHTGLSAATIARSFNRRPPAVASAVRSIERLLAEEPILGELLSEVERELRPAHRQATEAVSPIRHRAPATISKV